ncbi:McrB family protein [Stenotrophomonas maltophilia]|uniref:McrB family protein n=1 Tax=Stenotrophomonas maltophilia TaxID=40324 RepID=UPI003D7E63AA
MKKIKADRISLALGNIYDWRNRAKSQAATHLFPLLALVERGAAKPVGTKVLMNEQPHEFNFWNKYFRIDDGDLDKPYFNPITLRRAEAGFPHSNSATIRKNTFANKWGAASRGDVNGDEYWSLALNYSDIFRDKVLRKGAEVHKVPLLDVAVLLLRGEEFADNADALALVDLFREKFPQVDSDFERIFDFRMEDGSAIYVDSSIAQDYDAAIKSLIVSDVKGAAGLASPVSAATELGVDDPILIQVQQILAFGSSGIVLSGAPGTGKSYYASRIADHLVVNPEEDVFRVQLHPSYGYEDFVEGYRPDEQSISGYRIVDKVFMLACKRAVEIRSTGGIVVMIIDEMNRGDPARIFGELLTYIERSYRNVQFYLPFSGRKASIPENVVLLGTMNPQDRSVSLMDAAITRRFDRIELAPSREIAELILSQASDFDDLKINLIGDWFDTAQRLVPLGLGHSYFSGVNTIDGLRLMWRHRMLPAAEQSIEIGEGSLDDLRSSFEALIQRLEAGVING